MGLLFALALTASQINTGKDLLAACQARDTAACDHELAKADDCMALRTPGETPRQIVIAFLQKNRDYLAKPAEDAVFAALASGCE